MAADLDTQRFKTYEIGGNPLVKGDAQAFVFTALDGERRVAVAYANPDNADAVQMWDRHYLPAVVMRVKEARGWDYGEYPLYVSQPGSMDYEKVPLNKDLDTGGPSFGPANRPISRDEMVGILNSFRAPEDAIPHFYDADLSQLAFSPSPRYRSDRAFAKLRSTPPPQARHEIRPFAEYSLGDPPVAHAATFFDGRHRMAIIYVDPENPPPAETTWQVYTGALAATIKQRRGWDYGEYDLFVKGYPDWRVWQVTFTRDAAGAPTMSSDREKVDATVLAAAIRSFPVPEPVHIHARDLSAYHVDPTLDPE